MKSVKVLGVYGGSSGRDRLLSKHLADLLKAVQDAGAACERIDLEEKLDLLRNAEPSKKFVSPAAEELADNVLWADVLIVATPVHWRLPSLLTTAFIHQVLAPLEWGGMQGNGYRCWGKIAATLVVCDDDGAAMVASSIHDTLNHMGFVSPPWSSHHKNFMMGKSEDDWQNEPTSLAPILMEMAKRMRSFPSIKQLLGV